MNLDEKQMINEVYDIAMSLEVAEHIFEKQSVNFMDTLTGLANVILFSAAIPHQGGQGHVNEQWQSYWVRRFKDYGYECVDIIRDKIWDNDEIWFYYKQNMLMFVKSMGGYSTDL